mmetsp:Transcript_74709/g.192806  ORF Transcript_74709/g.192806 Transcript_74709/m.192806 type:complete len:201 (+) Transcript_74709:624-1226(+)
MADLYALAHVDKTHAAIWQGQQIAGMRVTVEVRSVEDLEAVHLKEKLQRGPEFMRGGPRRDRSTASPSLAAKSSLHRGPHDPEETLGAQHAGDRLRSEGAGELQRLPGRRWRAAAGSVPVTAVTTTRIGVRARAREVEPLDDGVERLAASVHAQRPHAPQEDCVQLRARQELHAQHTATSELVHRQRHGNFGFKLGSLED